MKKLAICAIWLMSSALFAETIGDVEFQFPPSCCDWNLLTQFNQEETDDTQDFQLLTYTHKDGDALELFCAFYMRDTEGDEEEDDDEDSDDVLANIRRVLGEEVGRRLPYHQILIQPIEVIGTDCLVEWELDDNVQDLVHGYARWICLSEDRFVFLNYMTTAKKTEENRALWVATLRQSRILL